FVPLHTQKVRLSLGEEIERHGTVPAVHLAAAAKAVRGMASAARRKRVASLDVFLTAPGRQATNSAVLVAALSRAGGVKARVLTKEEEGTLAYRAAVLPAGVVLLVEVQRKLGVTLHVCDGGIREGAVLASLDALAA